MPTTTTRTRSRASDITPAQLGKKYVSRNDKQLRDAPIAYSADGRRIFAYNKDGTPCCNARRPGMFDDNGEQIRCISTRITPNGRCRKHGGHSVSGVMHYNASHLRTSDNLPSHLRSDLDRALRDPDILNLTHEIAMVDVRVGMLKSRLGTGDLNFHAVKRVSQLMDGLETLLNDEGEITEEVLRVLIDTFRKGQSEDYTFKLLDQQYETRRKLVDTAHHRERDLRTMIKADQAVALVTSVAASCKESIANTLESIENRYILVDRDKAGLTAAEKRLLEEHKVTEVDKTFRLTFLQEIAIKLSSLIGKAREEMSGDPLKDNHENGMFAIAVEHPNTYPVNNRPVPKINPGDFKRAKAIIDARNAQIKEEGEEE